MPVPNFCGQLIVTARFQKVTKLSGDYKSVIYKTIFMRENGEVIEENKKIYW